MDTATSEQQKIEIGENFIDPSGVKKMQSKCADNEDVVKSIFKYLFTLVKTIYLYCVV